MENDLINGSASKEKIPTIDQMRLILNIPVEVYEMRDEIQNGSAVANMVLLAFKFSKPYEERPQGEWLRTDKDLKEEHPYSARWYRCSNCKTLNEFNVKTKFCPNCGALMLNNIKNSSND